MINAKYDSKINCSKIDHLVSRLARQGGYPDPLRDPGPLPYGRVLLERGYILIGQDGSKVYACFLKKFLSKENVAEVYPRRIHTVSGGSELIGKLANIYRLTKRNLTSLKELDVPPRMPLRGRLGSRKLFSFQNIALMIFTASAEDVLEGSRDDPCMRRRWILVELPESLEDLDESDMERIPEQSPRRYGQDQGTGADGRHLRVSPK